MEDELKYSYNVLKFDLTLGMTDVEVPIHAQRIDYVSPTDGPEISIRLQRKSNDALPLRPNGSIEAPFTRLYISAAAIPRTVFLMVGAPAGVRVTGRDVAISGNITSNILNAQLSTLVGRGELFSIQTSLSSAATAVGFQVKNPVGSGKIIEVISAHLVCSVAITTAGPGFVGRSDANLSVLSGNGVSHTFGGANSLGELRLQNTPPAPNPVTDYFVAPAQVDTNIPINCLLDAGEGFLLQTPVNTAAYLVGFLYREYNP